MKLGSHRSRRLAVAVVAGLGLWIGSAQADVLDNFSLTLTGVTDYDFRGVSQSGTDPAFQASVDFEHDSGFYAGVWTSSSLDFGGCCDENWELDYYGGFAGDIGESGFSYDVGVIYYDYPGVDVELDYSEFYAGIGYEFLEVKAWYTTNYFGGDQNSFYIEGNTSFDLPYELTLGLHVGYTGGRALDDDFVDDTGLEQYVDYAVSLSRSVGPFELDLRFVDTDIDGDLKVNNGANANDARVIFSVSTTLPWSDE